MTLLREIQAAAMDSRVDLADLLRKCKVLAARLKHKEFGSWVHGELNGYPDVGALPEYRKIHVQSVGHFAGPFGSAMKNAPIPVTLLPEEAKECAEVQYFLDPVGTLAAHVRSADRSSALQGKWPADLIAYVAHATSIYETMVLVDAWRVIPIAAILGVLDTVRTRILDFVLALEEESPEAGDVEPGRKPIVSSEKVTTIYNTVIQGGQANIGTSGDAYIETGTVTFSPAIPPAYQEELRRLMSALGEHAQSVADSRDRKDAEEALEQVCAELTTPQPRFERLKRFLELYATIVTVASPTVDALSAVFQRLFG